MDTPPEFESTRRSKQDSGESGTLLPEGGRSRRPAPLYPDPYLPLPERVDETDLNATRVAPAALRTLTAPRPPQGPPVNWRAGAGCLARGMIFGLFALAILILLGAIGAALAYASVASSLPGVEDLRARSAQFETTRLLDRNGGPLYEILDPNAGRRTYVSIDKISPYVIAATIATEDKGFYSHPGFDPFAIARAVWENLISGGEGPGASTITQQLARALLLSPEERVQRTYQRKLREIILAAEITRRYSKDEILELYLNEIYYGNLAYGIEAAAETYFGASIDGQLSGVKDGRLADDLNLAQAAFLAGLPQAPSVYDIHTNREATLQRNSDVLDLMFLLSQEENCIAVHNAPAPVCVSIEDGLAAKQAIAAYNFPAPNIQTRYPHWVQFVREQLEARFDAQTIYRSGFIVTTSLDPALQEAAQQIVSQQVANLVDKNASNGALVAIRPQSGEILAMVGSADFYNAAISGQVNMATTQTRQPGSSIKPFTYLAAFEKGWTPATLIWDVPSYFPPSGDPNDPREPYVPVNYDGKFHGPVTVRTALANSFNIPAVKTLQFAGIYDDPATPQSEGLIGMARRLGISSLTRNDYGLALTLGGGDVSLLEMTSAYAVIANNGLKIPPVAILKISDYAGNVIYEYQPPQGEQVIRAEHAYLMANILSDNEARAPMFGRNSVINLPFPAAAKTGTTNDFRDNWTMGFTPDLAVGVWVGNADYTPMVNTTGLSGAAPIWADFMQAAAPPNPRGFDRPPGIMEKVICALSGAEPSDKCPQQRLEIFASDQPPLPASEDLWKQERLDTWSGLRANALCSEFVAEKLTLNVTDIFARRWLRQDEQGRNWAEEQGFKRPIFFVPDGDCNGEDRPTLKWNLRESDTINDNELSINAAAFAPNFSLFRLEFGYGDDPQNWEILLESRDPARETTKIYNWDLTTLTNDKVTLRLRMENKDGGYAELLAHLRIIPPSPTPLPPSETPTASATSTLPPTDLPTLPPSETPTPAPSETPTPLPSETPSPSATPIP
ncbi:MAG: PBP1A family penicillin-binding protein [Anaerolineales bacterium]